jgi:nucleotide-binding universal stress UspA family protein
MKIEDTSNRNPSFNRILCPVDLSENSFGAISMATTLALQHQAKIGFIYVSPGWSADMTLISDQYLQLTMDREREELEKLVPTDASVEFDHHYVIGNPGVEIVLASQNSTMVVMSTHGRRGIARLLMGSVANYVLRHAECPVVLVKGMDIKPQTVNSDEVPQKCVTEIMHKVHYIQEFEQLDSVLSDLVKSGNSGAAVVNATGTCVGVLTKTDINKYHHLKKRFEAKDESVIAEMFEVDQFGQRRPLNESFDQVERHMNANVISVPDDATVEKAIEMFDANPKIHHLVVLDHRDRPIGMIDSLDVVGVPIA